MPLWATMQSCSVNRVFTSTPELDVTDIIITALNARMSDSSTQAAN